MIWILKYRLNPDWFFPDDESETEKTNREEDPLLSFCSKETKKKTI
jgi:hypothetical protein